MMDGCASPDQSNSGYEVRDRPNELKILPEDHSSLHRSTWSPAGDCPESPPCGSGFFNSRQATRYQEIFEQQSAARKIQGVYRKHAEEAKKRADLEKAEAMRVEKAEAMRVEKASREARQIAAQAKSAEATKKLKAQVEKKVIEAEEVEKRAKGAENKSIIGETIAVYEKIKPFVEEGSCRRIVVISGDIKIAQDNVEKKRSTLDKQIQNKNGKIGIPRRMCQLDGDFFQRLKAISLWLEKKDGIKRDAKVQQDFVRKYPEQYFCSVDILNQKLNERDALCADVKELYEQNKSRIEAALKEEKVNQEAKEKEQNEKRLARKNTEELPPRRARRGSFDPEAAERSQELMASFDHEAAEKSQIKMEKFLKTFSKQASRHKPTREFFTMMIGEYKKVFPDQSTEKLLRIERLVKKLPKKSVGTENSELINEIFARLEDVFTRK